MWRGGRKLIIKSFSIIFQFSILNFQFKFIIFAAEI